jgi:hypothetical protein
MIQGCLLNGYVDVRLPTDPDHAHLHLRPQDVEAFGSPFLSTLFPSGVALHAYDAKEVTTLTRDLGFKLIDSLGYLYLMPDFKSFLSLTGRERAAMIYVCLLHLEGTVTNDGMDH